DKEREREKRKALISEPVGEVRHTCHVGIDGTAFGLLQLDKKELVPPSVSPSAAHTNGTAAHPHLGPSLSQVSSPVLLRSTGAREGISVRETMSLRDVIPNKDSVIFREVVSPPISRAPSQPPPSTSSQASPQLRPSVSPSAPPLTESAANSMNRSMQEEFTELTSLNSTGGFSRSDETTRHRPPISASASRNDLGRSYAQESARDVTNTSVAYTGPATADTILCDEVEHLERDLTDFSLSSLNDLVDDTRPLISGNGRPPGRTKSDQQVSFPVLSAISRIGSGLYGA
ncbi:p21-Rho-binding domain protein, partial [Ostertagia ostertagi]